MLTIFICLVILIAAIWAIAELLFYAFYGFAFLVAAAFIVAFVCALL